MAEFKVVDDEQPEELPKAPLIPTSPLDGLRSRIQKAKEERTFDSEVPLGDDGPERLFVRYTAIEAEHLNRIHRMRAKIPPDDRPLMEACDALVEACRGIYIEPEEGADKMPMLGDGVTFASHELWEFLGVDSGPHAVRAIYPFDGSILRAQQAVLRFSDYPIDEALGGLGNL